MSKKNDLNYVASLEKAIAQKYGAETIQNPKAFWSDEIEKEYLEQLEKLALLEREKQEHRDKIEKDGFFIPKNLISKTSKRKCPVCDIYSFNKKDDIYMNKYESCYNCYIQWIEGRESRWESGWRPKGETK